MSSRHTPPDPADLTPAPCPLPAVSPYDPESLIRLEQTLALYARLLSLLRILKERADNAGKDPRT